jgi:hypothetical protein
MFVDLEQEESIERTREVIHAPPICCSHSVMRWPNHIFHLQICHGFGTRLRTPSICAVTENGLACEQDMFMPSWAPFGGGAATRALEGPAEVPF